MKSLPLVTARLPRSGLGNCLFVWAQAQAFAEKHGLKFVRPPWARWHLGTWLRRERDLRNYAADFLSDRFTVDGLRALGAKAAGKVAYNPEMDHFESALLSESRLIIFDRVLDWPDPFVSLRPYDEGIRVAFRHTLKPLCLRRADRRPAPSIGIHVRMGDFSPQSATDQVEVGNRRLPLSWYVDALRSLREAARRPVEATVFSDGSDADLRELLQLPQVRRATRDTAASDLLTLARSKVIIGTSGSTFSAWAAFLGATSILWYPGRFEYRVSAVERGGFQGAANLVGEPLPDAFRETLCALFPVTG